MSEAELKQATERLTAYYESDLRMSPMLLINDWEILARARLAEHPADSDEPLTDEWLRAVLPRDGFQGSRGLIQFAEYPDPCGLVVLVVWCNDEEWANAEKPATRGKFRQLAAALEIALKEPAQ